MLEREGTGSTPDLASWCSKDFGPFDTVGAVAAQRERARAEVMSEVAFFPWR